MNVPWVMLGQNSQEHWTEPLEDLARGFKTESASNELLITLTAICAAITLIAVLWRIFGHKQGAQPAPPDYLTEALNLLSLTPEEKADVLRLASRARLPQPAAMLLSPANLAYAYQRGFPAASDAALQQRLDMLCHKLFERPMLNWTPPPSDGA